MGIRRVALAPPLIEPIPLTEIFATGLAPVDHCGEYVRLTFFSDHLAPEGDEAFGNRERIMVARMVMPMTAYRTMVRVMVDAPPLLFELH